MGLAPITIEGRLAADPELRFMQDGAAVVNFRIAHTERKMNKQTQQWEDGATMWFPVSAWRGLAENIAESMRQGDLVIVHGRLTEETWTDRQSGEPRSRQKIEAQWVGASLSSKTVTVNRTQRQPGQQQNPQQNQQQGQQYPPGRGPNDPWQQQGGGWNPNAGQQPQDPWANPPQEPPF